MKFIGLDPGTARLGYAVLEVLSDANGKSANNLLECGVIVTQSDSAQPARLAVIRQDLLELLHKYRPEIAGVELLYFTNNIKTAISVAQARGVVLEVLASCGVKNILEFTPTQLKQIITGSGRADKQSVQDAVARVLGLESIIKPDDAADAVALAIACERKHRVQAHSN